jgi:hypothetical protein
MRLPVILAAPGLGLAAAMLLAPIANAECSAYSGARDRHLDADHAFIAIVVDVSAAEAPRDWHLELRTKRVIRGTVPATLAYDGWDVGCHEIGGNRLQVGDRLFIGVEHLRMGRLPDDPFFGDIVVWQRVEGRWQYADDVIGWTDNRDRFVTAAMRRPATTSEVVAFVGGIALPDTSTAGPPPMVLGAGAAPWMLVGAFAVALAGTPRRRQRAAAA